MRKLLTIAIAVERLYAVYLPSEYHLMNHVKFARRCCIFATFWGLCDTAAMIAEDDLFKVNSSMLKNYSFRFFYSRKNEGGGGVFFYNNRSIFVKYANILQILTFIEKKATINYYKRNANLHKFINHIFFKI